MRLHIANCTRQVQEIHYRVDFDKDGKEISKTIFRPANRMTIAPGRQIVLGGDMHAVAVRDIISQLSRYGLTEAEKFGNGPPGAVPYVYAIDKPVSSRMIQHVMEHNADVKAAEGKERRMRAAIIANDQVSRIVQNEFAEQQIPKEPDQKVEVEFEQLEDSGAGEKRIEEGYKIAEQGEDAPRTVKVQRRAGAGRRGK